MNGDIRESLLVWHASPAEARAAIERDGISIVQEAIFVGLHPGIPAGYAEKHQPGGYFISLLALPHDQWRWGWDGDYELSLAEGYVRRSAGRQTIVEMVDQPEAVRRQHMRSPDDGRDERGAPWCWMGQFGYDGWLDEALLAAQCDAMLEEETRPWRWVLGAAYLHFASRACRAPRLKRMCAALRAALASPLPLPDSAVALAVEVWKRADNHWASTLAGEDLRAVPFRRLGQLWAWLSASGDQNACRRLRDGMPSWQSHLDALTALMAVPFNDYGARYHVDHADPQLVECLVTILTHGPMHNARAAAGIRAIDRLADELADPALLELLRRLRFLPGRARRCIPQALLPRASRLKGALETIAAQRRGSIRATARHILIGAVKMPKAQQP
jgi:hypothetical protein